MRPNLEGDVCLGVPGRVIDKWRQADLQMAKVAFGGVQRDVCIEYVPEVQVGEYVLVHVGFAISMIDAEEAGRVLALLSEMVEAEMVEAEQ